MLRPTKTSRPSYYYGESFAASVNFWGTGQIPSHREAHEHHED